MVSDCSLPGAMVCLAPEAAVIWESVCGRLGHFYLLHSNKCNIIYIYISITMYRHCTGVDIYILLYILLLYIYIIYIYIIYIYIIYIYIYCNFLLQQHAKRPSAWVNHLQPSPFFCLVKTIQSSPYRWKEDGGAPFMMGISWEYNGIYKGYDGDLKGIYMGFKWDLYGI